MKNLKPYDKIICIDNEGVEDQLVLNKIYTVKSIRSYMKSNGTIYGVNIIECETYFENTFSIYRFKPAIKYLRRQKLLKLYYE